jgi:hypothetical protein
MEQNLEDLTKVGYLDVIDSKPASGNVRQLCARMMEQALKSENPVCLCNDIFLN